MPSASFSEEPTTRGRSSSSRLISSLRSRSRSRAASTSRSNQKKKESRRATSAQPEQRRASTTIATATSNNNNNNNSVSLKLAAAKQRRSMSRPAERTSSTGNSKLKKKKSSKSKSRSQSRMRTAPTTRHNKRSHSAAPPRPQPQPRIINLVDMEDPPAAVDDEDSKELLLNRQNNWLNPATHADEVHESPKSVGRFPTTTTSNKKNTMTAAYSSEEDDVSSEEEDSDDDDDEEEVDARDLLAQVNARMEQQRLMEEVKQLRATIEQKDTEIEQLTGQLRMAISTKCDLVIAHTELERLHESDMERRKNYADEVKRHNLYLQEVRAEVEMDFMNELTQLAAKCQESEEKRQAEVTEKDLTIKLLEQKIYRMEKNALQGSSARPDNDKVKFYKKRLGVVDQ